MDSVNLYDAQTNLSRLVERAASGEEISPLARPTTPPARSEGLLPRSK
jgi:antitoxin (DNA-binding transcriptional repressor) of toxin-antitoxin stability system